MSNSFLQTGMDQEKLWKEGGEVKMHQVGFGPMWVEVVINLTYLFLFTLL